MRSIFVLLIAFLGSAPALAWNSLGHKVVAEIAWQQLTPEQRQPIVDAIRHNPRFVENFANEMPPDVANGDKATQDHWIFQQAATWPDIIRKSDFDRPNWHYVDFPFFISGERRIKANISSDFPTKSDPKKYNVSQAAKYCLATVKDRGAAEQAKGLAYCWLLHLVGDMHQPLHSTAIFSDYFPNGDRGGNEIPLTRGRNLHSLWDNLLSRQSKMSDVARTVAELKQDKESWKVETKPDIDGWIAESHELAKTVVYEPTILQAVRDATPGTKLQPISLPDSYMREAGKVARQRIVAAGLRLGALLKQQ